MLEHREDGHEVVSADVHASDESSDEGVYYQTVAVGGRQGKLDASGGSVTNGAQRGATAEKSMKKFIHEDVDNDVEQDDFIGVRCQESDAPPSELEDIDPEVHLKHKEYVIRSNKNTLSSTQAKILGKREVDHGKNLGQSVLVSQQVSS